jgi:hypothetical protein
MPPLGLSSRPQVRDAKSPAERMRLLRRQRKFRRRVVKVEVDPREVDALIGRGYLERKDRDDSESEMQKGYLLGMASLLRGSV